MKRISRLIFQLLLIGFTTLPAGQATSKITLEDVYNTQNQMDQRSPGTMHLAVEQVAKPIGDH